MSPEVSKLFTVDSDSLVDLGGTLDGSQGLSEEEDVADRGHQGAEDQGEECLWSTSPYESCLGHVDQGQLDGDMPGGWVLGLALQVCMSGSELWGGRPGA